MISKNLGPVSAYALAKKHGYTGTEEEWAQEQASAGANAAAAKKAAEAAKLSEGNANKSATQSAQSAATAEESAASASQSKTAAAESAEQAKQNKVASETARAGAEAGAQSALQSAENAEGFAVRAEAAAGALQEHNTQAGAHADIRLLIQQLTQRLDTIANSDDVSLDQLHEIVTYIKDNRELIEQVTTGKVSVVDIVNNLTTNAAGKPLSAAMGVELKRLIDAIKMPTKLSEMADDTQHRTVTDEEKNAWNQMQPAGDYATNDAVQTAIKNAEIAVIDKLASPFYMKAPVVRGYLVPDYPLSVKTYIEPIQDGTGDPSPTNIRQIRGWDELEMTKCGENILFPEYGVFTPIHLSKGTNICLKPQNGTTSLGGNVKFRTTTGADLWYAIDAGATFVSQPLSTDVVGYTNLLVRGVEHMMYIGTSDIPFVPYSGKAYTQTLPEKVFGGVYGWESGELSVNYASETFMGEVIEKWFYTESTKRFGIQLKNPLPATGRRKKVLCNIGVFRESGYENGTVYMFGDTFYYHTDQLKSVDELKKWLVSQSLTVVYPLETPRTIQLPPESEILAQKGVTTLYSKSGDTDVTGRADPNAVIEKMQADIAALQNAVVKS